MSKRVIYSPQALADTDEILDYLDENVSPAIALRFYDAVEQSIKLIAEVPGIGAIRQFNNPALEGMRMYVLKEFSNHLIFYREQNGYIEIVRILDGRRDLIALFG